MNTAQKGFTLIELMIVIAIIGILAAIAIPAYQNYTAKAQATEAVTLLGGLKTAVVDLASSVGMKQACSANAAVTAPADKVAPAGALAASNGFTLKGKYVTGITAVASGTAPDQTCTLTATYGSTGINDKLAGKKVNFIYNPAAGGSWSCTSDLEDAVRPNTCTKVA